MKDDYMIEMVGCMESLLYLIRQVNDKGERGAIPRDIIEMHITEAEGIVHKLQMAVIGSRLKEEEGTGAAGEDPT